MRLQPNILLIDDEEELLAVLELNLKLMGFQCQSSGCLTKAADLLSRERFDLVVCDVVMPGLNGLEFFTKMKGLDTQLPPFLFYTGLIEYPLQEPYPPGILGFMPKPFSLATFLKMLPENLRTELAISR